MQLPNHSAYFGLSLQKGLQIITQNWGQGRTLHQHLIAGPLRSLRHSKRLYRVLDVNCRNIAISLIFLRHRGMVSLQCFFYPFGMSTILPITPPLPSDS